MINQKFNQMVNIWVKKYKLSYEDKWPYILRLCELFPYPPFLVRG